MPVLSQLVYFCVSFKKENPGFDFISQMDESTTLSFVKSYNSLYTHPCSCTSKMQSPSKSTLLNHEAYM